MSSEERKGETGDKVDADSGRKAPELEKRPEDRDDSDDREHDSDSRTRGDGVDAGGRDGEVPEEPEDGYMPPTDEEWGSRRLCSDGNCIGVIGPDGLCKECGKPSEPFGETGEGGDPEPARSAFPPPGDEDADIEGESDIEPPEAPETDGDREEAEESGGHETDPDSEWERRKLCVDGNCIGVIGPDGRCKECGKPYDP